MGRCRILRILRIISLALIIARRSVVRRIALHADVVVGVGKIILPYSTLTHHTNGKDQEQTRNSYAEK